MLSTYDIPNTIKLADMTPVFKKKDPLKKENYRPVSVLSTISQIFGNCWLHRKCFVPIPMWLYKKNKLIDSKRCQT